MSISVLWRVLTYIKVLGRPPEATAINQPQVCSLNKAATIRLPQLLLNNEATSMRQPQLASVRLILRQYQENVLTLLGIILFWFLIQADWFLKHV